MSVAVSVAIPRWQWRTVAPDLSSLFARIPAPRPGAGVCVEEIHLVCEHSSHSAFIAAGSLELRWRKETGPEGFELWDTILRTGLPYSAATLARLWAALGLAGAPPSRNFADAGSFLDQAIATNREVIPVRVVREKRSTPVNGIVCELETIRVGPAATLDSLAIEHEDPSLMAQLLADLRLDTHDNINLLQGLKGVLGLQATDAGSRTWPGKSNANIS